jgi:hypothetical protein
VIQHLGSRRPASPSVRGMQSAEVEHAYRRAAEIGENLGDVTALYKAKWGLWLNANVRQKTALARNRANELVDLARRSNDGDLLLEAYHCGWSTVFYRGEVAATLDLGRKGVETYDINRHRHLGHAFGGHDPGVCAHSLSAVSLQLSGNLGNSTWLRCRRGCPSNHLRDRQGDRRWSVSAIWPLVRFHDSS